MLIPKFSIRFLLGLMTVVAVICFMATYAVQGQLWAIALCYVLLSIFWIFLSYGFYFLVTWLLSLILSALSPREQPTSPFATLRPPPQIFPPQDPE